MQGFGAVEPEPDEPVFHHDWERTVFGLAMGTFSQYEGGQFRHAVERMDPAWYLASSYYEHWLCAVETLLLEKGLIDAAELRERGARPVPGRPVAAAARPPAVRPDDLPRHSEGEMVTVRAMHPAGHTRCPRYVRGRRGTVVRVQEPANLDDVTAHGGGRVAVPVYLVRFDSRELWGDDAEAPWTLMIELWETYLE